MCSPNISNLSRRKSPNPCVASRYGLSRRLLAGPAMLVIALLLLGGGPAVAQVERRELPVIQGESPPPPAYQPRSNRLTRHRRSHLTRRNAGLRAATAGLSAATTGLSRRNNRPTSTQQTEPISRSSSQPTCRQPLQPAYQPQQPAYEPPTAGLSAATTGLCAAARGHLAPAGPTDAVPGQRDARPQDRAHCRPISGAAFPPPSSRPSSPKRHGRRLLPR